MFPTFSPHNCFEISARYIFLTHFSFSKLLVTMCWTFLGTQSMISSQRLWQNLLDLRGKMRLTMLTVFDERPKPQPELFNLEQISQVGRKWITVQRPPASSRGCVYHFGCVVCDCADHCGGCGWWLFTTVYQSVPLCTTVVVVCWLCTTVVVVCTIVVVLWQCGNVWCTWLCVPPLWWLWVVYHHHCHLMSV